MNLKKLKQIVFLGSLGFLLIQAAKATGLQQDFKINSIIVVDTTITDSARLVNLPVNDPKLDFKNLFVTATLGDGINAPKLNPLAISFVQNYIARNGKGMISMKEWGKPYFDMMDVILQQHGVPKELKYLAVIESGLKYNAKSFSGAVGPWAFMPAAAKEYGLKMTKHNDDRLDYFKSTHAAARLLTDLYVKYGDWLLVIAAYNGGPGNVNKAIKKSGGSKDFWTLQYALPAESMNHVKKFIATHYIFEGEGGITTVTKKEMRDLVLNGSSNLKEDEMANSTAYVINGRFNSSVIIKYVEMDMVTFNHYNPNFDTQVAINGKYELRLPTGKMNVFIAKRYEILNESMQLLLRPVNGGTR